ncbi:FG-GAP-like repeat-containing protein, partial [Corallococcus interemptor]|uniref:FG-GAP-like repeat-containing protein n=1 Tax=Corallococcus interemptor TaxID=2316720 RepID=UPI003D0261B8
DAGIPDDAGTPDDAGVLDAGSADDAGTSDDAGTVDGGMLAEVPSPPEAVGAVSGDGAARVFWTAAEDHGSPLTGYTVTASPGGASETVAPDVLDVLVTGLTNGTQYTFTVVAMNAVGPSTPSQPSGPVTPAGRPGAPSGVVATAEVRGATVSWTAPETNGSPITRYAVDLQPAVEGASVDITGQQAHITGLANGTPYTFTVRAWNAVGEGPTSAASPSIATPDVPGAPLDVSARAEDGAATASWSAPASDGGHPLTGYTVTLQPGDVTRTLTASQLQTRFTDLTNGTAYTLRVVALNAVGAGPEATGTVTPVGPPAAPTDVVAVAGPGQLTLTWTAPASTGGSPVTAYRVTPSAAGVTGTAVTAGPGTGTTLTGLPRGTTYTVTIAAVNAVGTSVESEPSAPVTTPDVPGAPRTPLATALGNGRVRVDWTPPASNGGSPLTRYVVRASPSGRTATVAASATSATVLGLAGGTQHTFTVQASNALGDGPLSEACDANTPCGLGLGGGPRLSVQAASVVIADFNEDGIPDVGYTGSALVGVLLGDGAGGLTSQPTFATVPNGREAQVADFNQDGHADLVFPSSDSGGSLATVVFGNGSGRFTSKRDIDIGTTTSLVSVTDLEGDGKADLVMADWTGKMIRLLHGDGTGDFPLRQDIPFADNPRSVAAGDFNGDGRTDLFVTHNNFSATVLLADATGGFQTGQTFSTGLYPMAATSVDLNGDGKLDLAYINRGETSFAVALGDGTGQFGPPANVPLAAAPTSLTFVDLDGDDHLDAVVNQESLNLALFRGDGAGGFNSRQEFVVANPGRVVAGDLDSDGRQDLLLPGNPIHVMKGDGQGGVRTRLEVATTTIPSWTAIGDLNGDGKLDLAAGSSEQRVNVSLGNGDGRFGASRVLVAPSQVSAVAIVDLDGNGRPDLVTSNAGGTPAPTLNGNVSVWMGDGAGGFGVRKEFATGVAPNALLAEDFTGDGKVDLVTANGLDHTVSLLAGDGAGGFAARRDSPVTGTPVALASMDVDGDGRRDLVVVDYDGNVETVRNDGTGFFTRQQSTYVGSRPRAIALGDFNGDGRMEAAVASSTGNFVTVLSIQPTWGLTALTTLTTAVTPQGVVAADFDRDGTTDLVITHNPASLGSDYFFYFYPGRGTNAFGLPVRYTVRGSISAAASADLDADGRPDLITSQSSHKSVGVFMNFCL